MAQPPVFSSKSTPTHPVIGLVVVLFVATAIGGWLYVGYVRSGLEMKIDALASQGASGQMMKHGSMAMPGARDIIYAESEADRAKKSMVVTEPSSEHAALLENDFFRIGLPAGTYVLESPTVYDREPWARAQNFAPVWAPEAGWSGVQGPGFWQISMSKGSNMLSSEDWMEFCRVKLATVSINGRMFTYCEQKSDSMGESDSFLLDPVSGSFIGLGGQDIETQRVALKVVKDGLTWK